MIEYFRNQETHHGPGSFEDEEDLLIRENGLQKMKPTENEEEQGNKS